MEPTIAKIGSFFLTFGLLGRPGRPKAPQRFPFGLLWLSLGPLWLPSGLLWLPLGPPLAHFSFPLFTFCHTLSYFVIAWLILSYFVILCHILSYLVISCHAFSYPRQSFLRFTGYSSSDIRFRASDPDTTRHNAPQHTRNGTKWSPECAQSTGFLVLVGSVAAQAGPGPPKGSLLAYIGSLLAPFGSPLTSFGSLWVPLWLTLGSLCSHFCHTLSYSVIACLILS
jgi:hypothetical protein